MDRASATIMAVSGLISGWDKSKTIKMAFTVLFFLTFTLKEEGKASPACVVVRGQLYSKTDSSLSPVLINFANKQSRNIAIKF